MKTECPPIAEEFDIDFLSSNPGVAKSQKYQDPDLNISSTFNCQFREYNQGLNINRRGQITKYDFEQLQKETYDPNVEKILNDEFGQQPLGVVIRDQQRKDKVERFYQDVENNKEKIKQKFRQINVVDDTQKLVQFQEQYDEQMQLILPPPVQEEEKLQVPEYPKLSNSSLFQKQFSIIDSDAAQNVQKLNDNISKQIQEEQNAQSEIQMQDLAQIIQQQIIRQKSVVLEPKQVLIEDQKLSILNKIQEILSQEGRVSTSQSSCLVQKSRQITLKLLHGLRINFDESKIKNLSTRENEALLDLIEIYRQKCSEISVQDRYQDQSSSQGSGSDEEEAENSSSSNHIVKKALMVPFRGKSHSDSSESVNRKSKLGALQMEYNEYIGSQQGIFVLRCQLMSKEFKKVAERIDLKQGLKSQKKYEKLQNNLIKDQYNRNQQTIVIDIENTLVSKLDIKDRQELNWLQSQENFETQYYKIDMSSLRKQRCCEQENCICDILVYKIRPYALEFLRAIQPFYELICYSKNHSKVLEGIVDHLEWILNGPARECLNMKPLIKSPLQRMKNRPQIKVYFTFIIHQRNYFKLKDYEIEIENFHLLTKNRKWCDLIFLSSNPFNLVAAISQGIKTIPIVEYETFSRNDFQLNLVENYILKLRYHQQMPIRLLHDFKFLAQKNENAGQIPQPRNTFSSLGNIFQQAPSSINSQEFQSAQSLVNGRIEYDAKRTILEESMEKSKSIEFKLQNRLSDR